MPTHSFSKALLRMGAIRRQNDRLGVCKSERYTFKGKTVKYKLTRGEEHPQRRIEHREKSVRISEEGAVLSNL